MLGVQYDALHTTYYTQHNTQHTTHTTQAYAPHTHSFLNLLTKGQNSLGRQQELVVCGQKMIEKKTRERLARRHLLGRTRSGQTNLHCIVSVRPVKFLAPKIKTAARSTSRGRLFVVFGAGIEGGG